MTKAHRSPVVMQVIPALKAGGAEQGCIDMAAELTRSGATSIVVCNGGERVRDLARAGATYVQLPVDSKNPFVMYRNVRRLRDLIRKHNVDIVHARSRAPAWSSLEACRGTNAHYMTTCHAPYTIVNPAKKFYNSSIARGERVIAISEFVADYLHQNYTIDPSIIRIIPRGVALDRFHPTAVTPDRMIAVSRAWRLPDAAQIVLMPARLTRWKGHEPLIEAMAKLNRRDVFCVLLGSTEGKDEYKRELEDKIAHLGLDGRVRIVEHCTDMPAAYMLANVVVSASTLPEGFGRVAVEAQAMGRPCVATDHGGSRETIRRGETGWLVPPNDPDSLSRAIQEALSLDGNQRAILATRAMAHVAAHFTREKMADDTMNVYAELLQAGPAQFEERPASRPFQIGRVEG